MIHEHFNTQVVEQSDKWPECAHMLQADNLQYVAMYYRFEEQAIDTSEQQYWSSSQYGARKNVRTVKHIFHHLPTLSKL